MKPEHKLIIVDGTNTISRAFFAVPQLSSKKGIQTNAIVGAVNTVIGDMFRFRPSHMVIVFDRKGGSTWRKELYPDYKIQRLKSASREKYEEMFPQIPIAKKLFKAMGIRVTGKTGEEADDVIATLTVKFSPLVKDLYIRSSDKDFAQLVGKNVRILEPKTNKLLNRAGIFNKYGVSPESVVEWLMLMGDSTDNIPGVKNVADKTASKLLATHGSLKEILASDDLTPALAKNLKEAKKQFKLTRKLVTLKTDIEHKVTLKGSELGNVDYGELRAICKEFGLKSTYKAIINCMEICYGH